MVSPNVTESVNGNSIGIPICPAGKVTLWTSTPDPLKLPMITVCHDKTIHVWMTCNIST